MASRLKLQRELERLTGVQKVYFQPPESVKLVYPCIIYDFSKFDVNYADDAPYRIMSRYEVTVIDKDPDSSIPVDLLKSFKYVSSDRFFVSDNLNHWVFTLYY